MARRADRILAFLFAAVILAACSTRKSTTLSPADVEMMEIISHSPAFAGSTNCLTGNMKFTADVDGSSVTTRGTLRIKNGEGVQVGMTALGLVEVACLEFLPDNARLIYKIGREYADLSYSSVPFLQEAGIDYGMLEAVLLNRLFLPGSGSADFPLDKMTYGEEEGRITAQTAEMNGIVYKFFVDGNTGNLVRCEGTHENGGRVVCRYSDFSPLDNDRPFPRTIELTLEGLDTEVTLQFVLSRASTAPFDFAPRTISPSYGKRDIMELINSLGNN